jgi:hypothetical protein
VAKFTADHDAVRALLDEAWTLSDAEIESLEPGMLGRAAELVAPPAGPHAFSNPTRADRERPDFHLLRVLRDPANFAFTCRTLFGSPSGKGPLEILPFQQLVLHELWWRQFPMLLASRGAGKCVRGDTLVMTDRGVRRMKDIAGHLPAGETGPLDGVNVLGEPGFRSAPAAVNSGETDTVRLVTRAGYLLEGTPNHPVRVAGPGGLVWKNLGDVAPDDRVAVDRTPAWFEHDNGLPPDLAYLFGVLVGDGGYTVRGHITITSADPPLVEACSEFARRHFGKPFRPQPSNAITFLLCGVDIWDSLFEKYGFNSSVCGEKDVPTSVLGAPRDSCVAFIRGLFDTDGTVSGHGHPQFTSKSEQLVRTVQFLLGRLGMAAKVSSKLNKKYNRYYWTLEVKGQCARVFYETVGFGLRRKQDLLLSRLNKAVNSNVDTIPRCVVGDDLDALRAECRRVLGPPKWGGGAPACFKVLNSTRLAAYELTYEHLGRVLAACSFASGHESYRRLETLYRRRTYFDSVKSLTPGRCVTYDVTVPDGNSFISNGLVSHNSFLLALYAVLRATFCPGAKVVIVAASFRQAKAVFEYVERLWHMSPVYRDLVNSSPGGSGKKNGPRREIDRVEFSVGDSVIVGLPMGTGEKIRGMRANYTLADELASINEETYAVVVQGFASVTADPVGNVKDAARARVLKRLGLWTAEMDADEAKRVRGNQSVVSGTASYRDNHFYRLHQEYRNIILTRGDPAKLAEVFGGQVPEGFDWRAFSVTRLPHGLIPGGYMDRSTIARARQINTTSQFLREYETVFPADTDGFFRRSLVLRCTAGLPNDPDPPAPPSCQGPAAFLAAAAGDPARRHVIGVDPASESDRFAVVVLELHADHRRVVHVWSTRKSEHRDRLRADPTREHNFYSFAARKIRDLMAAFPCDRLVVDQGGGGVSVREALGDPAALRPGEEPIYPRPDPRKPLDTDDLPGRHVLTLFTFSDGAAVSAANHSLKKDMESRLLLFPPLDQLALGAALGEAAEAAPRDTKGRRKKGAAEAAGAAYDTLEECMLEVEELKEELTSVVVSTTAAGREHWAAGSGKGRGGAGNRPKKDRYSALLMANWAAREEAPTEAPGGSAWLGGHAQAAYLSAPQWFLRGGGAAPPAVGVRRPV